MASEMAQAATHKRNSSHLSQSVDRLRRARGPPVLLPPRLHAASQGSWEAAVTAAAGGEGGKEEIRLPLCFCRGELRSIKMDHGGESFSGGGHVYRA